MRTRNVDSWLPKKRNSTPPHGTRPVLNHPVDAVELKRERKFLIDNLLVRIHYVMVTFRWTGLAQWEFEFPFPGSLSYLPSTAELDQ